MRYVTLILVALALGSLAAPVGAATINYGVTSGGTLSYAGGDSPLVGTNIPLGGQLLLSSTAFLSGGGMDFSTGPFSHFDSFGVTPVGTPAGGNAFFSPGGK